MLELTVLTSFFSKCPHEHWLCSHFWAIWQIVVPTLDRRRHQAYRSACDVTSLRQTPVAIHGLWLGLNWAISPHTDEPMSRHLYPGLLFSTASIFCVITAINFQWCSLFWCTGSCVLVAWHNSQSKDTVLSCTDWNESIQISFELF